jgi:hypothetical protein
MLQFAPRACALSAALAASLLAACGGASFTAPSALDRDAASTQAVQRLQHPERVTVPGLAAQPRTAFPPRGTSKSFKGSVWVSDAATNTLEKCTAQGCKSEGGVPLSEPQGLGADKKGNIYVTDTSNTRVVELNEAGKLVATFSDPGEYPVDVAVATDGTVAVTNIITTSGGNGDVAFYAPGATSPTSTATGLLSRVYFGGFDSRGDFYVDGADAKTGAYDVAVVAKGSTTIVNTPITGLGFPGGIQVGDPSDLLNVEDQTCPCIRRYKLPSYRDIGTIGLPTSSDPVTFAFAQGDADIWVGETSSVAELSYPAGKFVRDLPVSGSGGVVAVPVGEY